MPKLPTLILVMALVAFSPVCLLQAAPPVPGAIFTTVADGSIVNANVQYNSKCDVYLNGGPGKNAPAGAAGLPAGEYYFQVTDSSGQKLLSTDAVSNRKLKISAQGVIVAYTGTGGPIHPIGISQDHPELGSLTVRLANAACPSDFLDTTNEGGVYKAWVTPVADFAGDPSKVDNACGNGCFHGFVPSKSKTDNFKVKATKVTFCLSVTKKLDAGNDQISPGFNWPLTLLDPLGTTNLYSTNETDGSVLICGLAAGAYTLTEFADGYPVLGLTVNGVAAPPQPTYSFVWTELVSPNPFVVVFRNRQAGGDF